MQDNNIEALLEKYHKGTATAEEQALVESWYLKHNNDTPGPQHQQLEQDQKESLSKLLAEIKGDNKRRISPALVMAASLLLFLGIGAYFRFHYTVQQNNTASVKPPKNDAVPGGNKAILTLANGSTVVLTDAKNGIIASQGGITVAKTAAGQIKYAGANDGDTPATLVYNTAATPRGGQYQFILSDGTKVWLNSASSIKYPVAFAGNERKVELNGEAYFEVAHNAGKPFRVASNGQTVEVLGTHFNINAYSDETMVKTTLLEGSVKVFSPTGTKIIKPGEQARFKEGNITVKNVDVAEAIAWKNGFFYFEDNTLQDVMKQLSRWYDVDVKYQGQLPERQFSGEISRNINASQMLDILSFKKIHYKIEGKTITITP
ncbi:MAG: FecR protein [Mucilaginibacter sp.]|nr:FecR protein [Mucilaginibacter sp.]